MIFGDHRSRVCAVAAKKLERLKEQEKAMAYQIFRGDPGCMVKHLEAASYIIQHDARIP